MRIPGWCFTCDGEGRVDHDYRKPDCLFELSDDGTYVGSCSKGHTVRFVMPHVRYELLYESGIMAMLCGFHREAVASLNVSAKPLCMKSTSRSCPAVVLHRI